MVNRKMIGLEILESALITLGGSWGASYANACRVLSPGGWWFDTCRSTIMADDGVLSQTPIWAKPCITRLRNRATAGT